jgi:Methyltransferase FkbM domain
VLPNAQPFLVKLDIEGYELEALRGATAMLARPTLQAVIMEINASGARHFVAAARTAAAAAHAKICDGTNTYAARLNAMLHGTNP